MDAGSTDVPALTADERAAARAFVARCEVRLSTFHRIAVGMLSGAGLLVVLPVVARDSITGILGSLVDGGFDAADVALIVAVLAMLAVPAAALWLLFVELTRFYFHANHIVHADGEVFTPRFTLTGLRSARRTSSAPPSTTVYGTSHGSPNNVALLVPSNRRGRERIDRQLAAYPGAIEGDITDITDITDATRGAGLFELAASRRRSLVEEVVKVEYGIVRHMLLRLQVVVLRYVKALLALLTTAIAVYVGDAVVAGIAPGGALNPSDQAWLAAVVLVWAPLVVLAVTSPVRWIERAMRDDGAPSTAVADDPELTFVERVSLRIAAVGWVGRSDRHGPDPRSMARSRPPHARPACVVLAVSVIAVGTAAFTGRFRSLATIP